MSDYISRQEAIDALRTCYDTECMRYESGAEYIRYDQALAEIENAPSAWQWIQCNERMPEEHDSIFVKIFGTSKWSNSMWATGSDDVIVTSEFEDGTRTVENGRTHDGKWWFKPNSPKRKVIAWMPMPEPHKENDGQEQ